MVLMKRLQSAPRNNVENIDNRRTKSDFHTQSADSQISSNKSIQYDW